MKIEYLRLEATTEELAGAEGRKLVEAFEARADGTYLWTRRPMTAEADCPRTDELATARVPGVDEEGQTTVRGQLSSNPAGALFFEFLERVTSWPHVGVHGIKRRGAADDAPLDYSRYLRVRKQGSRLGGFVYAYASDGTCNVRLHYDTDEELAAVAKGAWRLDVGHREYRVNVQITDRETLEQAVKLARIAYDAT